MKQQSAPSRLFAAWLLTVGLVLSTSGWGGMLTRALSAGFSDDWRCGQAMCACLPAPVQPACLLCDAGLTDADCPNAEPRAAPDRVLLFHPDPQRNLFRLPAVGEGFAVAAFLAGLRAAGPPAEIRTERAFRPAPDDQRPLGPSRDVPTPPPRAAVA